MVKGAIIRSQKCCKLQGGNDGNVGNVLVRFVRWDRYRKFRATQIPQFNQRGGDMVAPVQQLLSASYHLVLLVGRQNFQACST